MADLTPGATYIVKHDGLAHFVKGDEVPSGTFDDEQLVRLLDLGAIEEIEVEPSPIEMQLLRANVPHLRAGEPLPKKQADEARPTTGNAVVDEAIGATPEFTGPTAKAPKAK